MTYTVMNFPQDSPAFTCQFQRCADNIDHDAAVASCVDDDWFNLSIMRKPLNVHWLKTCQSQLGPAPCVCHYFRSVSQPSSLKVAGKILFSFFFGFKLLGVVVIISFTFLFIKSRHHNHEK